MRISRLYVAQPLIPNQAIELDEDNAHYVRTVLRLKTGDAVILFNGDGGEYTSVLAEVSRKHVRLSVQSCSARTVESPLQITLGLGISRGDRMDLSVQKAVELGVNSITPLLTERCVIQFTTEKKQQRRVHWQKIIQHAVEQSGRTVMPELTEVIAFQNWVDSQHKGLKVFLDPYADKNLTDLSPADEAVVLLTGPEGGFSEQERKLAVSAGFIPVRLGSRILRTETASIAALAAVQMLWGDFR
ncbi:MAG: 16S rRNA (uracil(1498)-N(3))-methyltransferase [Methylococcaceae bacterium]|nr:16S rRNA (uracil(1498)-N(3))-methyltransferase [Methylococcaceae bacterium]